MTAIVGVINSQGIAIAADSALTVSGGNIKKVYNKSNKIFTLSKYHPVGIAIYNTANFMGVPLETLIKMYRAELKDKSHETLTDYKDDFLVFLANSIQYISPVIKTQHFYDLCRESFNTLIKDINDNINVQKTILNNLEHKEAVVLVESIANHAIDKYNTFLSSLKISSTVKIEYFEFETTYSNELNNIITFIEDEIKKTFTYILFTDDLKNSIKQIMFNVCKVEYIFEMSSGLVFIGFGEKEVYPSSQVVTVGHAVGNFLRYSEAPIVTICPGIKNSDILPYAQGDVTFTVLTGIDPSYNNEINKSIESAFTTVAKEVVKKIRNKNKKEKLTKFMENTSLELIKQLGDYKQNTITNPLLDTLVHMGKEDMAELAESLVNITSLKRKFTTADSNDESVGGPVDVAIITKGDGFIWMKRKHYFDTDINKGFLNKYYKS